VLSGEATHNKFIVFGLTRPWFKPTIYRTRSEHRHDDDDIAEILLKVALNTKKSINRSEHANHYATDAVSKLLEKLYFKE
jgi:hypothetical protein